MRSQKYSCVTLRSYPTQKRTIDIEIEGMRRQPKLAANHALSLFRRSFYALDQIGPELDAPWHLELGVLAPGTFLALSLVPLFPWSLVPSVPCYPPTPRPILGTREFVMLTLLTGFSADWLTC